VFVGRMDGWELGRENGNGGKLQQRHLLSSYNEPHPPANYTLVGIGVALIQ
jgi:hypothetical protein